MKKTNKIILGTALASGVVACFGSAFALYKKTADKINIGIGEVSGHTDSTDEVKYLIKTITAYKTKGSDGTLSDSVDLTTSKLSPDLNKVYLDVPLSFEYGANSTAPVQAAALGHLNVTVDIASDIAVKGATVTANLTGYSKDGGTAETYFTKYKMNNFFATKNYSEITAENGFATQSGYIDTAIDTSNIHCIIGIDMSTALTDGNAVALAEISNAFKVTVNWSPYQEGNYSTGESWADDNIKPTAYVRGDRSDWQCMEDYRMVPNIGASKTNTTNTTTETVYLVEWTYKLLKEFTQMKVYDSQETQYADIWVSCRGGKYADGTDVKITTDGNAILSDTDSYNVYYVRNTNGTNNVEKGFWVQSTSYKAD